MLTVNDVHILASVHFFFYLGAVSLSTPTLSYATVTILVL